MKTELRKPEKDYQKLLRKTRKRIKYLEELISNIQWVQPTWNGAPSCSGCGAMQHQGCEPNCRVAETTKDFGVNGGNYED